MWKNMALSITFALNEEVSLAARTKGSQLHDYIVGEARRNFHYDDGFEVAEFPYSR
jgi:hypothetical protein